MNKLFIVIGIILLTGLVISAGGIEGVIETLGGGVTPSTTAKQVTLTLDKNTVTTLSKMERTDNNVCAREELVCTEYETYPIIECEKWKDERLGLCEIWIQPRDCTDFDKENGICLKWNYELKCLKEELRCTEYRIETTYKGITNPKINPKGCNEKECCYDILDPSGYLNRYNTCLPAGTSKEDNEAKVLAFVEQDLKQIATHLNTVAPVESKTPEKEIEPIDLNLQ